MPATRRMGDRVPIAGDYQYRALHAGHPIQRFWHASKLQLIDTLVDPRPGEHILDVGCGSGVCCGHLVDRGALVTGVDANTNALAFARRTFPPEHATFLEGYVDDLALAEGSFDKAICFEVVEHLYLPQVDRLLRGVYRLLKPGGLLAVTTPNYRSLWPLIECLLDRLHLVPTLDGEQHVTKFRHETLRSAAETAGFRAVVLRSICTLGPWIAPLSRQFARLVTGFELSTRIPAGAVLAHIYRKES